MVNKTIEQKMMQVQVNKLENQFSELFSLKCEMLTREEGIFTALYLNSIGYKQYQKYRLTIDISIIKYRINLIKSFLTRNEKPDLELIEDKINERFGEYQKNIEQERQRINQANHYLKSGILSHSEVNKIKNAYKLIVKKLHPDLHPFQTEDSKALFEKSQTAYNESDLKTLNEILGGLNQFVYTDSYNDYTSSTEFVRQLEKNISGLRNQIEQLENQFPFSYRLKLADDDWVEMEQKALENEISALTDEKIKMSKYLLLLHVWKPESLN